MGEQLLVFSACWTGLQWLTERIMTLVALMYRQLKERLGQPEKGLETEKEHVIWNLTDRHGKPCNAICNLCDQTESETDEDDGLKMILCKEMHCTEKSWRIAREK